jgi:hypothetical protein
MCTYKVEVPIFYHGYDSFLLNITILYLHNKSGTSLTFSLYVFFRLCAKRKQWSNIFWDYTSMNLLTKTYPNLCVSNNTESLVHFQFYSSIPLKNKLSDLCHFYREDVVHSYKYFKEGIVFTLKFYSLFKWEKRKLQVWNEDWNFIQNQRCCFLCSGSGNICAMNRVLVRQ